MRRCLLPILAVLLTVAGLPPGSVAQQPAAVTPSAGTDQEILTSLGRGLTYLAQHQKEDGSWEHDIGITGLVVRALLDAPPAVAPEGSAESVARGLGFIISKVQEDGGIYVRDLPNYNTAVALQALVAANRPQDRALIDRAREYLVKLQADESAGYTEADKFYGGIGYGADLRPDLANLEYALSALKEAALPADHPLWDKAIRFVQRSQNRSESNDQEWAGNDGGFVYYPGFSYGGETNSYGSMTYAGLLSYSYADVERDDPRVAAALDWIRNNYSVDENPGMGARALYYYYLVFAKALDAYGEEAVVDADGVEHDWRQDLGAKLVDLQHSEGYWVNDVDPSWWQDNKVLVTAFTAQALEYVLGR